MLRLAVPSKGALYTPSLRFMKACGLEVLRASDRRYVGEVPSMPGVTVHFQRAGDIAPAVENGVVDVGLVGEDDFRESQREGGNSELVVPRLGFGHSDLVLGVPDFWVDVASIADLADLSIEFREQNGDLLRVATKFPRLVERFLLRSGLSYFSLVPASGTLEAAPTMGTADVIVDITSTGTTLRENRLKTIHGGTVMRSEACLVSNMALVGSSEEKSALARELVERVQGHVRSQERDQGTERLSRAV